MHDRREVTLFRWERMTATRSQHIAAAGSVGFVNIFSFGPLAVYRGRSTFSDRTDGRVDRRTSIAESSRLAHVGT